MLGLKLNRNEPDPSDPWNKSQLLITHMSANFPRQLISPWTKWPLNDILKSIFTNEKFCILIHVSLKFVPKGLIDNESVLVRVIA